MAETKPDKCFTCGSIQFCWTLEKGWTCLRCDPPSMGIQQLVKEAHQKEAVELPYSEKEEDLSF